MQGHSVVSITRELKKSRVKSPSSNTVWSKRAIETLLANEKYVGDVTIDKTFRNEFPSNKRSINNGERIKFEMTNSHKPIIQREVFNKVQQEHKMRSNIEIDAGKAVRKNTRYSMKSLVVEKAA